MRAPARRSRGAAALCVAAAVVAGPALASTPAYADSTSPVVSSTNWYWSGVDGPGSTTPLGAGPVAAPTQASGIPDGDLGVAYTNDVDKVAALNFGFAGIPAGSTVTTFSVVMPLDTSANNLAESAGPAIEACPALAGFTSADGPSALSTAPAQALNVCVPGKYDDAKKTYTFDLATVATDWVGGAPAKGVVIRPKQGSSTPFNYAFQGRNAIAVTANYTAGAGPVTAPPAAPPTTSVGTTTYVPPPTMFYSGTTSLPAASTPTEPAPVPEVAASQPAVAAVSAPPSTRLLAESLRPSGGFWLLLVVFGAIVLFTGLVLGDPLPARRADRRRSRFADIIAARAAAAGGAVAPVGSVAARPRSA